MARPQWITDERIADLKDAYKLIPGIKKASHRDFRPPPTLESDFKRLLEHDVPHTNFTFELIHERYTAQEDNYEPVFIRAQQTPIDWKSKIGNSDMSTNFKTSFDHQIFKGDIAVREDGTIYLLNWNVTLHPNNQSSQLVECNDILPFPREHLVATNQYGFEIDDEPGVELDENGREIIVKEIPASHSEYAGRPEYSVSESYAGVNANNLINIYVQWNCKTKGIRIDDTVEIGSYTYVIQNVYTAEVNIHKTHGCLYLQARREAGGAVNGH